MSDLNQFDDRLKARGWRYDHGNEQFMAGDKLLHWEDVISLVPGMTLDELAIYADDKYNELRARQAAG